ncbi:MAG TPA: hypothetical protein VIM11_16390 [Tepidisphaeraceae bacterium]|jgi:hypothetical protein
MPPKLDYQHAKVIYRNTFKFRSWQGVTIVAMGFFICAMGAIVFHSPSPLYARLIALGIAMAGLGLAGTIIAYICLDRRDVFDIRTDGIVDRGVFHGWADVTRFAAMGSPKSRRVWLFYKTRAWPMPRYLSTTRPVRVTEYEGIVAAIRGEVGENYPQLKLGGYEQTDG